MESSPSYTVSHTAPTAPVEPDSPLDDLKEMAAKALGEAREKWEVVSEELEKYVRANPGKSLLAAVGVGVMIGLALKD